jgi:hypothetical protein
VTRVALITAVLVSAGAIGVATWPPPATASCAEPLPFVHGGVTYARTHLTLGALGLTAGARRGAGIEHGCNDSFSCVSGKCVGNDPPDRRSVRAIVGVHPRVAVAAASYGRWRLQIAFRRCDGVDIGDCLRLPLVIDGRRYYAIRVERPLLRGRWIGWHARRDAHGRAHLWLSVRELWRADRRVAVVDAQDPRTIYVTAHGRLPPGVR